MSTIWRVLLGGLLFVVASQTEPFGQAGGEVKRLYEEAQRYHLGIDRPRNLRKAYEHYQNVLGKDARHVDAHYNLANICYVQKRYDLAAKFYQKVIQLRPEDADAYNNLGTVYERQGRVKQAKVLYRKAVQTHPDLAVGHYNLARLFLEEGKTKEALAAMDQALRVEPDNSEYVNMRARIMGSPGE